MKKFLAMSLLTMTLTMCFGLTAFAAGSVNTNTPVVSQQVLNSHQAATTVDKVTTANGTEITFQVFASTPQVYKNATQAISNVLAAPVAGQNYQVDASSPL